MARLVSWLLVLAAAVAAVLTILPPAPGPAAQRGLADVERIAVRPHVAGSPANDAVREYLLASLRGMGLEPRVQDTVGVDGGSLGGGTPAAARVRNVVATVPGTGSTGRVFVVAHYDSVQAGPGANDDGAGVATLLETARSLQANRPRNDVVLLFTDAEEACLCGAQAFVAQAPEGRDGGVVLNVEARGTTGPVIMFETTAGNAAVVRAFGTAAPHPVATSFAVEVYRILPNDTDFSPFRDAGRFTGLNSAYIDGSAAYHGPEDTPGRMDPGSLQMHMDNATGVVAALGAADLAAIRAPSADATYFPVFGWLARYPGWLVWPLAGLAALAVVGAFVAARRRGSSWGRLAGGTAAALVPLLGAPVLAQLAWRGVTALRPGYAGMSDPWHPGWDRAAITCLVLAVVLGWILLLRRRIGTEALAVGGLVWLAVLGLVLADVAPGGSYLTALPALAGGLAMLRRTAAGDTVAALVAVIVLLPTAFLFFPALGLAVAAVPAFVLALLGLALVPVLDHLPRLVAPAALAAALVLGGIGFTVNAFGPGQPEPSRLMYLLDADTRTARWLTTESAPGAWTRQYVVTGPETVPGLSGEYRTGPADAADLPPAAVTATRDGTAVTVRITPQRAVRLIELETDEAVVRSATVAGVPVPVRDGYLQLVFHAPPPEGVELRLELTGPGPVHLRVTDGSDGLAGLPGFRPRPPEVGIGGSHDSELVAVTARHTV